MGPSLSTESFRTFSCGTQFPIPDDHEHFTKRSPANGSAIQNPALRYRHAKGMTLASPVSMQRTETPTTLEKDSFSQPLFRDHQHHSEVDLFQCLPCRSLQVRYRLAASTSHGTHGVAQP